MPIQATQCVETRDMRYVMQKPSTGNMVKKDPQEVCIGSVHDRMLETLSKSLPQRHAKIMHASTLQVLCKHPASPLQADTFYLQATIWRIAGVQVLARFWYLNIRPSALIIILIRNYHQKSVPFWRAEGFSAQSPFRILLGLPAPQRQHSKAALL